MERSEFKIMVLDDEPDWRRASEKTLTRAGFTVVTASTGAEAVETARAQQPHMAVMDINLPDCSGAELVEQVKAVSPDTIVVMLSGVATLENAGIAASRGSADILEKIADDPDEKSLSEELTDRAEAAFEEVSGG